MLNQKINNLCILPFVSATRKLYHILRSGPDMEVAAAADKLIKLSPSVRVVTVCDMSGKLVYTAHKKSVHLVLSKQESKESLRNAARSWKARKKLTRKLGKCNYVVAHYEKVNRITMPAGKSHLIYVTTSGKYDPLKVVRKVRTFK